MQSFNAYCRALFLMLPTDVRNIAIIAGGALRSYWDNTDSDDVDLFFRSESDYQAAAAAMRAHCRYTEGAPKGRTLVFHLRDSDVEVNLIGFAYGTPGETISRFDFRCCQMAAWVEPQWESLVVRTMEEPHAVEDAENQVLHVLNCNGLDRTLRRTRKYLDVYGYTLGTFVEPEPLPEFIDIELDLPNGSYQLPPHFVRHVYSLPEATPGY